MWPYKNHSEEKYYKTIEFIEEYVLSLGAVFVGKESEKFTTYSGNDIICETLDMNVFKYGDEYFWIEHHFLPDCPYIVLSFGETIESIFEDAEPFPYNLSEDKLKAEVRCSLGIDKYAELDSETSEEHD
jgi:hypothetical protein